MTAFEGMPCSQTNNMLVHFAGVRYSHAGKDVGDMLSCWKEDDAGARCALVQILRRRVLLSTTC